MLHRNWCNSGLREILVLNSTQGGLNMAITRWDPLHEYSALQHQMNRLFQGMTPSRATGTGEEFMTTGTFVPPVDVYEDEHNIVLKLEVPGIDEKDIDVRVQNNTLTVRGERKLEKEEK